jgi:hypothetical protein
MMGQAAGYPKFFSNSGKSCVALHWLTCRAVDRVLGVFIIETSDLMRARFRANL